MRLLEVFKDFNVTVTSWTKISGYNTKYKFIKQVIPLENPNPITLQDLQKYVENLQERYPQRGFYLRKHGNFYILSQKTTIVDEKIRQEINNLRRRLREINKRALLSVVDRYERMMLTQKLSKLRRRVKKKRDVVPLYFMVENGQLTGRVFVPETYIKTRPKLVNYICMITLGSLGISQSRYVRMLPR